MHNFCKNIFITLLFCIFVSTKANVVININKGVMKPVSIAVNISGQYGSLKSDIMNVMINDLQSTYLFRSIPEAAFMQNLDNMNRLPIFSLWKTINAQYLVNGEVSVEGDMLRITFILYDVLSEEQVSTFSASGHKSNWRKIVHLAANSVYKRITGENGYFDTRLLYVSVNKQIKGKKIYRLAVMDQDGFNHQFLTDGSSIVLTPRLSPDGKECAYFSYREKIRNGRRIPISAAVYRYNFATRKTELVTTFKGMTYAPRYSPDGRLLVFSLSQKGASSIYTMDLRTKEINRLTKTRCIDTSPCYSPDGKYIVFNSDRGGTQQLYIMDADGSNVRRLSFSKGRYATPVWSPRGDWIAFTKFGMGGFYIGVIRPDGSGERMVASAAENNNVSGYLVEGPTWSPNGRVILFSHQDYSKKEKIFSVDITGYNKHEIVTPFDAIDAEWSISGS